MSQQAAFDFAAPLVDPIADPVRRKRDEAIARVAKRAETERKGFVRDAQLFVRGYLLQFGPTSGEVMTEACKEAGIVPHDDRAFGAVYLGLARRREIVKVGTVPREKGNGTAGGNIWRLR